MAQISFSLRQCVQSFKLLNQGLEECNYDGDFVGRFRSEASRFRIWAENAGAHRIGKVSLDHRLREASKVKQMVIDLLDALNGDLQQGNYLEYLTICLLGLTCYGVGVAIVSGTEEEALEALESWSSGSSGSSVCSLDTETAVPQGEPIPPPISLHEAHHETQTTISEDQDDKSRNRSSPIARLEECLVDVAHIITCLYDFSISIRNPVPRDRLQKCSKINVSHFEWWDIQHVLNKFQGADEDLLHRLGKANTRRRQLLRYYEKHRQKIAGHSSGVLDVAVIGAWGDSQKDKTRNMDELEVTIIQHDVLDKNAATVITGASTKKTQTTVSTYVPPVSREPDTSGQNEDLNTDAVSESGQTQTSFAGTITGTQNMWIPSPPGDDRAFEGIPFECPYCFSVIKVHDKRSWM